MRQDPNRKKIGILGGTFDPIHTGHLILAETAYEEFRLDNVWMMPNGNPPHKPGQVQATMDQRIEMTRLAIADNPHLVLSDLERTLQDYHYTYQTLEYLTAKYSDTDFYFIIGGDSLMSFEEWREPARICKNAIILAAARYRMDHSELQKQIDHLCNKYQADIRLLETPNIDISSQMLRERIKENKYIKYYVPFTVDAYIREQKLYLQTGQQNEL